MAPSIPPKGIGKAKVINRKAGTRAESTGHERNRKNHEANALRNSKQENQQAVSKAPNLQRLELTES